MKNEAFNYPQFPARLKHLRIKFGWTQAQLAERIGTVQSSVSEWEKGEIHPSLYMVVKLMGEFELTIDELLGPLDRQNNIWGT